MEKQPARKKIKDKEARHRDRGRGRDYGRDFMPHQRDFIDPKITNELKRDGTITAVSQDSKDGDVRNVSPG